MHEEHYISQIRKLLGITANKRADGTRGAMDYEQSWKASGTLRLVDRNAYIFILRAVGGEHY